MPYESSQEVFYVDLLNRYHREKIELLKMRSQVLSLKITSSSGAFAVLIAGIFSEGIALPPRLLYVVPIMSLLFDVAIITHTMWIDQLNKVISKTVAPVLRDLNVLRKSTHLLEETHSNVLWSKMLGGFSVLGVTVVYALASLLIVSIMTKGSQ